MVAGYHLIWTAYGWWLPNDPRGSTSHTIRDDVIAALGELHHGRKRVQPTRRVVQQFYEEARSKLKYNLLTFDDAEIDAIATSFSATIRQVSYTCYACSILPDHVHLLIRKHRDRAEDMLESLQAASRRTILDHGNRIAEHPVWAVGGWKVFLDTRDDIERTIRYINDNPRKARRPAQHWDFVSPYDGWLPGLGIIRHARHKR